MVGRGAMTNSIEELTSFFHFLCKHNENYEIIENFVDKSDKPDKSDKLDKPHEIDKLSS